MKKFTKEEINRAKFYSEFINRTVEEFNLNEEQKMKLIKIAIQDMEKLNKKGE